MRRGAARKVRRLKALKLGNLTRLVGGVRLTPMFMVLLGWRTTVTGL
jgi:hypothetical protein